MKLLVKNAEDFVCAWFEPGDQCQLRVACSKGVNFVVLKYSLQALKWRFSEGEQLHFADDDQGTSYLFTRDWNGSNQERTRRRAFETIQAFAMNQFIKTEKLDKVEKYKGRRKVAASAPIDQLPGLNA